MAEPKTEVDRRFDRIEYAIRTLAYSLLSKGQIDGQQYERLDNILEGVGNSEGVVSNAAE